MSNDNADRVYWEERAMTAERMVIRLKELIKQAEWSGGCNHSNMELSVRLNGCPWCHKIKPRSHSENCAAFTVEGEVK